MALKGVQLVVHYTAWDTANNVGKTGDSANHTLRVIKDGTPSAPTNSPTQVDSTNAPGVYKITLTATEMNADSIALAGKSSTSGVVIIPVLITTDARFVRRATAQAGAASTITLDASASATNDVYRGEEIWIVSGTGADQVRRIVSYNGTTKVATVDVAWATNPSSSSVFEIRPSRGPALTSSLGVTATGVTITSASSSSGQVVNYSVPAGYDFTDTLTVTGRASPSWGTMVWLAKASKDDADSDALIEVRVTNPADAGTDGLLLFNRALPAVNGLDKTYATLSVGATSPDTVVSWTIRAAAMNPEFTEGVPLYWEVGWYEAGSPAPKKILSSGTLALTQGLLRSNTSP